MQVIKRCRRPLPTSTILVPAEVNQVRSLVGHSLHSTPQVSSGRAEHDEVLVRRTSSLLADLLPHVRESVQRGHVNSALYERANSLLIDLKNRELLKTLEQGDLEEQKKAQATYKELVREWKDLRKDQLTQKERTYQGLRTVLKGVGREDLSQCVENAVLQQGLSVSLDETTLRNIEELGKLPLQ